MEENNLYRALSDNVCRLIHGRAAETRHRGGWERLGSSTGGLTILNHTISDICARASKIHMGEYNVIRKCKLIEV